MFPLELYVYREKSLYSGMSPTSFLYGHWHTFVLTKYRAPTQIPDNAYSLIYNICEMGKPKNKIE